MELSGGGYDEQLSLVISLWARRGFDFSGAFGVIYLRTWGLDAALLRAPGVGWLETEEAWEDGNALERGQVSCWCEAGAAEGCGVLVVGRLGACA